MRQIIAVYRITATVVEETDQGTITHQIPTFSLEPDIQGIVSEQHAEKIATDILNPCKNPKLTPHVHAMFMTL